MGEKIKSGSEEEIKKPLEAREATTDEEVKQYFSFADPILKVAWGEDGPPEEYTPEYIAAHPELTKIFVVKDERSEVVGGAKIKKLTVSDKGRLNLNEGFLLNQSGVLLEYEAIRDDYRKQGLLSILTQKRIDWAKEHGAEYACAEVEITRPISAYTKIRDGFVVVGIKEAGEGIAEPYFVLLKQISGGDTVVNKSKQAKDKVEWKEVEVNEDSCEELRGLFSDGWIGVDMKPKSEEMPWILILEKN